MKILLLLLSLVVASFADYPHTTEFPYKRCFYSAYNPEKGDYVDKRECRQHEGVLQLHFKSKNDVVVRVQGQEFPLYVVTFGTQRIYESRQTTVIPAVAQRDSAKFIIMVDHLELTMAKMDRWMINLQFESYLEKENEEPSGEWKKVYGL